MVYYNEEEMKKFQSEYIRCNEEIIESLLEIDYEFENIEKSLETPKSTSEIPKIISFMKDELKKLKEDENIYNERLNYIINNYNEKIDNIHLMVGDGNVK